MCKKENHIFSQKPIHHLKAILPCKKCDPSYKGKYTSEEWIEYAKNSHELNQFDYSKTKYINVLTKVTITCLIHKYIFEQYPRIHIKSKICCPKGIGEFQKKQNTKTQEQFIEECVKIHNNLYDYKYAMYVSGNEKVEILCKEKDHGLFLMTPSFHINCKGKCPKCSLCPSCHIF